MTQYLLALHREYAAPILPDQAQQMSVGLNALGDKLTDAGAFVFRSGLPAAESAIAARMTKQAS
jgi:hypothetical protein